MSTSKFTEYIKAQIEDLKSFSNAMHEPTIFKFDSTSFNEQVQEHIILGRIYPQSNRFKDEIFQIHIKVPFYYPLEPVIIDFLTPIQHESVDENGKFYHELLSKTADWTGKISLVEIVKALINRIDE